MKFERTQIHFLTDVFTVVVVVVVLAYKGPQHSGTCDTQANEHTVASYV